jgi:hypothetical protein
MYLRNRLGVFFCLEPPRQLAPFVIGLKNAPNAGGPSDCAATPSLGRWARGIHPELRETVRWPCSVLAFAPRFPFLDIDRWAARGGAAVSQPSHRR